MQCGSGLVVMPSVTAAGAHVVMKSRMIAATMAGSVV
jgi:hypothetical protein